MNVDPKKFADWMVAVGNCVVLARTASKPDDMTIFIARMERVEREMRDALNESPQEPARGSAPPSPGSAPALGSTSDARVAELEAALAGSTALLDDHEWAGSEGDFVDTGVIGRAVCPDCYVVEGTPHADDCELMARLKANRALLTTKG